MTSVLLFEFDKIFTLIPTPPSKSIKDQCFRPLPQIQWIPEAWNVWKEIRRQGIPAILVSYENEAFIKEAIYGAGLCPCFDHFIFVEELRGKSEVAYEIIMGELGRVYGLCKPYTYRHSSQLDLSPLKLHFG